MSGGYLPSNFANTLHATITEKLEQAKESLSRGGAEDFSDYRRRCGYIAALRDLLEIYEETRTALLEGKQ